MSMDQIVSALTTQVPDLVVLLIIVFQFLRYLEKRDKIYLDMVEKISMQLALMSEAFSVHAQETTDAVAEMHRVVNSRRKDGTKPKRN